MTVWGLLFLLLFFYQKLEDLIPAHYPLVQPQSVIFTLFHFWFNKPVDLMLKLVDSTWK